MKTYILVKDNEVQFRGNHEECIGEHSSIFGLETYSDKWYEVVLEGGYRIEPEQESEK